MHRYAYHDLYPTQFEDLVVAICTHFLGAGVQPFSTGPDEGRDARFQGTASDLPNSTSPHKGVFVVQAKHTEHPFAKFSDSEFSGDSDSAILTKEIPRIKRLFEAKELDHYLLFSNRRLAGKIEATIRQRIITEVGAVTVEIFGIERIEMCIKQHPRITQLANISEVNQPLRVSPDDIAEVIIALAENKILFEKGISPSEIQRTSFAKKNEINGLSSSFVRMIRREHIPYFDELRSFLAKAPNAPILDRYLEAIAEFNDQILTHRREWGNFDDALVYLQKILFQRDGDLRRNKRLTKRVIYYMYWNCDLGEDKSENA